MCFPLSLSLSFYLASQPASELAIHLSICRSFDLSIASIYLLCTLQIWNRIALSRVKYREEQLEQNTFDRA